VTTPAWLDELRLDPGPPWVSMGTRPLDDAHWLVVDDGFNDELAQKAELLARRHDEVFGALPESHEASTETLEVVQAWMKTHHPDAHPRPPVGPDLHPLDHAGRLVQEDLCLMFTAPDGSSVLGAGSVCFPSHWRLADKLGLPAAQIHAPVPHYETELRDRVDRFLGRLRPGRGVVRRNLSVHNHPNLFAPEPHESPSSFTDDPAEVWLRSERQTLRRLPRSGAVLFTIKTQQCRLAELTARPDIAVALGAKLAAIAADALVRGAEPPFPTWLPTWLSA
jgi:hypothetical protein